MNDILIIGAGGLAREVAFLIEDINKYSAFWRILGFVDMNKENVGKCVGKYSIICTEDELLNKSVAVVIGIGDPLR